MALRNKELVDRGFTNVKSQIKTLDHMVSRGGADIEEFRKFIKVLYEKVEDLESLIEREGSHVNG
tara:strand:+ start:1561 stop:1755 length:195 start_codon:yes stop_codon:yes gene_type:complete